ALGLTLCAVSLLGFLIAENAIARARPNGSWDAVAIWNARARFFYRGYEAFPESLQHVERFSHPHYPLLVPGAVTVQNLALGTEMPGSGAWTGVLFGVGIGVLALVAVWN